jgi:hypothetical protein
MSTYENGIYGLFTLIITVGFIYELGSGVFIISGRKISTSYNPRSSTSNLANSSYIFKSQMISRSFINLIYKGLFKAPAPQGALNI